MYCFQSSCRGEKTVPLLLWFNVKEPQLPPLLGREASGFLFLFLLLPVSEVLQNDGLALQEVLPDLLAHVGHAPFQEGPHEGLGPLGARVLNIELFRLFLRKGIVDHTLHSRTASGALF